MCDRMMVALLVDAQKVPGSGGVDSARTQVWNLIWKGGLGTTVGSENESPPSVHTAPEVSEAELKKWTDLDRRYTLIIKERLQAALAGPPENMIVFELTSGPGAPCICNATWNNYSPPQPHPERAPIVPFLRSTLSLSCIQSAAFFYGPSGIPEPETARTWDVTAESPPTFLEHFYTEERGKVIGNPVSGFFLVRPQRKG